jgi:hypothetical protein
VPEEPEEPGVPEELEELGVPEELRPEVPRVARPEESGVPEESAPEVRLPPSGVARRTEVQARLGVSPELGESRENLPRVARLEELGVPEELRPEVPRVARPEESGVLRHPTGRQRRLGSHRREVAVLAMAASSGSLRRSPLRPVLSHQGLPRRCRRGHCGRWRRALR